MNIILDNIIGKKVYIIYVILKYIKEESNLVIKERKIRKKYYYFSLFYFPYRTSQPNSILNENWRSHSIRTFFCETVSI